MSEKPPVSPVTRIEKAAFSVATQETDYSSDAYAGNEKKDSVSSAKLKNHCITTGAIFKQGINGTGSNRSGERVKLA